MPIARFVALATLAGFSIASPALAADANNPTVVELFQSQGCSSCPPANAVLNSIAGRPDVLALSFAVTYWDRLGWKDIFAHRAYTARQWEYSKAGRRGNVSTPQMIINGRGVLVGSNKRQVEAALRTYERTAAGPSIAARAGKIAVAGARAARPANVWLVRYDPRVNNVPIRAGENGGRTLPHRNIVRSIHLLGKWSGGATAFNVPPARNSIYQNAVLVQDGPGGAILAARRI
ncbi:MAG: DUF1223 domain-containing protein [Pseudomonadota bacterium]|nr:DUF1223 domain-containing protein [Sphingomonas sp.]MDQ3479447.1 DUF1223 domain-containing protein [Pseudomonadota bacterium]